MTAAYLYDAVRTPFGRFNGALAGVRPDDLASYVIKALLDRHPHLDGGLIDEVIFGNANGAGKDNRNLGRMAGLLTGLSGDCPTTVNRLCGSQSGRGHDRLAEHRDR
jgi:acetyl-CoA acetyltransferase